MGCVKTLAVIEQEMAELGLADAHCVSKHCLEHGLQIAGRAADNPEHLGRCRLLFQRFRQFPRALLLCLKQPRILNRDHCLVSESLGQLDLLVRKWTYGNTLQEEDASRSPLPQ